MRKGPQSKINRLKKIRKSFGKFCDVKIKKKSSQEIKFSIDQFYDYFKSFNKNEDVDTDNQDFDEAIENIDNEDIMNILDRECEYGFTSNYSKCEPCSQGKYGDKCGNTCDCHIGEKCDHKKGCVPAKNGNLAYGSSTSVTTIYNLVKEGKFNHSVIEVA
ncbi:unnamed protein product [Mytilus coruscus]|uniref:MEGF10_11 n=1 Tax=Mytilus coruscus TaxID=42192 RepID=A0A6J8ASP0_MYTCO|nr:unnamed protein product [Mytilus coruscus]